MGFVVFGGHLGLLGVMGLFYPSANRANGVGWALSIGKLGAIVGPGVAAVLIANHTSLSSLLMIAAAPLPIVAIGSFALGRLQVAMLPVLVMPLGVSDLAAELPAADSSK